MTREEALRQAVEATRTTRRKHVVREDHGKYTVCPLFELDGEGARHDPGYSAYGVLVAESIK